MVLGCLMTRERTGSRLLTTVRCSRKRRVIHEPRPPGQGTPRCGWMCQLESTSGRHLRWPELGGLHSFERFNQSSVLRVLPRENGKAMQTIPLQSTGTVEETRPRLRCVGSAEVLASAEAAVNYRNILPMLILPNRARLVTSGVIATNILSGCARPRLESAIPVLIAAGRAWLTGSALQFVFPPLEDRIAVLTVLLQIMWDMVRARLRLVTSGIIRTNTLSVVSRNKI